MSSFRPETPLAVVDFVATPILATPPEEALFPEPVLEEDHAGAGPGGSLADTGAHRAEEAERVEAADEESSGIVLDEAEMERREESAYARGLDAGRAEAAHLDAACATLDAAAEAWSQASRATLEANREAVLDLTRTLVERWVGESLEADAARYAAVIERAATGFATPDAPITLSLAPRDVERLQEAENGPFAEDTDHPGWSIAADESLSPGDFRLAQGAQVIDGRRAVVAERMRAALESALGAEAPDGNEDAGTDPRDVSEEEQAE